MAGEIVYNDLEECIAALKKLGVKRIALAEIRERRPQFVDSGDFDVPGTLDVVVVKRAEILAYHNSDIHKCIVRDVEPDDIYGILVAGGFEVKRRSRNMI